MTCSVHDCSKPKKARGMCAMHYKRFSLYGDVNGKGTPKGEPKKWLEAAKNCSSDECLIWPFNRGGDGYGRIMRYRACKLAHREMCEIVHGPPPTSRHEAAHTCGNGRGGCVNPKHLRWATPVENQADRIGHGTSNRGERHGNSVLTEPEVLQIRALKGVVSQKQIAASFGVSRTAIRLIHNRKTWGWLDA